MGTSAHLARALQVTLLAGVLVASACGSSEPALFVPTYDPTGGQPVPVTEFCPLLAQAMCGILRPCCEASPYAYDEAKCRLVARGLCEARRVEAQGKGSLAYDDHLAGKCLAGIPSLVRDCSEVSVVDDVMAEATVRACRQVWHGDRPVGAPCDFADFQDPLAPTACAQVEGARIECAPVGRPGQLRCTALRLRYGGEDCTSGAESPDGTTCVSRAPGGTTFRSCCAPGLQCKPDTRRCTGRFLPLGATCTVGDECGPERYCSAATGQCAALPGLGEGCSESAGRCGKGARCDRDKENKCVEAKPAGAACGRAHLDCASRTCFGVCVPGGIVTATNCSGALVAPQSGEGGFVIFNPQRGV